MTDRRTELYAAGVEYQARGWLVFALGPGKVPLANCNLRDCRDHITSEQMAACECLTCHASWAASADAETLRQQLAAAGPSAELGLRCGRESGVVVVDLDPDDSPGWRFDAAFAALSPYLAGGGRLVTSLSPRGGAHLFIAHPDPDVWVPCSVSRISRGVDIKADGGYVVLPPSAGRTWHRAPGEEPLPRMTARLREAILGAPDALDSRAVPSELRTARKVAQRGSSTALAQFVAEAGPGERNNVLHWAACRAGEMVAGGADPDELEERLVRAAGLAGLDQREATRTVRAAMRRGLREAGN